MSESNSSGVHVASVKLLLIVWVALMIGTWLTVSASNIDLGFLNIWVGLAIASAKAVLVGLYYMHLRWDRPFNAFVFLGAFFFLSWKSRRRGFEGQVFWLFVILHGASRFVGDFFRHYEADQQVAIGGVLLSDSQLLSAFLILAAALAYGITRRRSLGESI